MKKDFAMYGRDAISLMVNAKNEQRAISLDM
jgi:hypothetical protein